MTPLEELAVRRTGVGDLPSPLSPTGLGFGAGVAVGLLGGAVMVLLIGAAVRDDREEDRYRRAGYSGR